MNIDMADVARMREEGKSYTEIATFYGTTRNVISGRFKASRYNATQKGLVGYVRPETLPKQKVFDLNVGDIITALEPEISHYRHKYKIVSIGKELYICERVGKYPYRVAFRIKDYGQYHDDGKVRKI